MRSHNFMVLIAEKRRMGEPGSRRRGEGEKRGLFYQPFIRLIYYIHYHSNYLLALDRKSIVFIHHNISISIGCIQSVSCFRLIMMILWSLSG